MKFGFPIGISTGFWFIVGLIRAIYEHFNNPLKPKSTKRTVSTKDIAVLLPAHNEEKVIVDCIQALKQSFKTKQIYVSSDGSTDNTTMLAKKEGCHVIGFAPGIGKARALVHMINEYDLYNKYKFIFIIDADTRIDKTFIPMALPVLEDPEVGALFAVARIKWPQHVIPSLRYYFIAYRERLNRMLQFFLIYGQTWKYTNVSFVIPGFCTIYRSSVLKQLRIDTPGLLIEDFNLAFQFVRKKLGTLGYSPKFIAWDQHPDNLSDYWKQVRRWNIGFFQTVRMNGFWPSFFWLSLSVFTIEVFLNSMFTLALPFVMLYLVAQSLAPVSPLMASYANFYNSFGPFTYLDWELIIIGYFWFDYAMSVVYGLMCRKPQFMIYGLFFFVMHYITSLILLSSLIPGFFSKSDGRWNSPTRLKDF